MQRIDVVVDAVGVGWCCCRFSHEEGVMECVLNDDLRVRVRFAYSIGIEGRMIGVKGRNPDRSSTTTNR